MSSASDDPHITVCDLTMAYGSFVLMHDLNFTVKKGDVFVIMGGSGTGKSTLLRHMIGLSEPAKGDIRYGSESFTRADPARREQMVRRFGVLYQSGGLWSSMTLAENVGLPLGEFTDLTPAPIRACDASSPAARQTATEGLVGKKVSPTVVGVFVLGAIVLAVIGVMVFGSGRFFRHTQEFVMYFDRSVNGLRVGAPVKFKGVE